MEEILRRHVVRGYSYLTISENGTVENVYHQKNLRVFKTWFRKRRYVHVYTANGRARLYLDPLIKEYFGETNGD